MAVNSTTEIESRLRTAGYTRFKDRTRTRVCVLADGDRVAILRAIESLFFEEGATYNPDYRTPVVRRGNRTTGGNQVSSLGVVQVGDFLVYTAPASRQGGGSAGLGNENNLIACINNHLVRGTGTNESISIALVQGSRSVVINDVIRADSVGTQTAGRAKSDVNLVKVDGTVFPISLKQNNAQMWESADTLFGDRAKDVLSQLSRTGRIQLSRNASGDVIFGNGVSGVAIPTTDDEATNVIFGSDILANGGAVLKQTFMSAQSPNCSWDPVSQTLTITGTKLYTQLSQVRGTDEEPVILIRRDSSRQAGLGRDRNWKGLRVLVVYRSRITGGVRRFTREEFRGIL